MKNKLLVIIFFFISLKNHNALSQNSPKVPNSIRIDNILLNIKPEAKEIIQIEARSEKLVAQDINGSLSVFDLD